MLACENAVLLTLVRPLMQGKPLPLASVASLASKVLLEQSQEAAAVGERMVKAAQHEHSTIVEDVKQRSDALATEQKMAMLASKDETDGQDAKAKAQKASKAARTAEEARNEHRKKSQTAAAEAIEADKLSAKDDYEAKSLEADAVSAARDAEENLEHERKSAREMSE